MNRMKSLVIAALVTLALSSNAFAGNIYGISGNIYGVSGNIYGSTSTNSTTSGSVEGNIYGVAQDDVYGTFTDTLLSVVNLVF